MVSYKQEIRVTFAENPKWKF